MTSLECSYNGLLTYIFLSALNKRVIDTPEDLLNIDNQFSYIIIPQNVTLVKYLSVSNQNHYWGGMPT